jgi:NitT/TauT family transport system ATP-binding protein
MGTNQTPLMELQGIHQSFEMATGQKLRVLRDLSLQLMPNEVLVILGPSGSGKSTCLRIMAGLLEPSQGKAFRGGEPIDGPNPDVAMVFQNFALLPWLTVAENVAVGLDSLRLPDPEVKERVKKAIDFVGLEGFEDAYPKELSGGMKQRVGIARALVMERPVLFLDEPFSSLDVLTAESLRREVLNLWTSKKTPVKSVVLITHNIFEAVSLGSRILVMGSNPGQVRLAIRNDLPYPRDEKSGTFRSLVEDIHDVITEAIIPDTPEWVPPALLASTVESIPPVSLPEMVGLVELIAQQGGRADAFILAQALVKDSVKILLMAKAAELLDLVDTPKNSIVLTDLGRRFVGADVNERKKIFREQALQLQLIKLLKERISSQPSGELSQDDAIAGIQEWLPNELSDQVLDTLIQWGRYGEIINFDADTQLLVLDSPGE